MRQNPAGPLDRELADLPAAQRWRHWMGRIEAALFASSRPLGLAELGRVVGQAASVTLLIEDIQAELVGRPYELAPVAGGWMFRTRAEFASAVVAAADVTDQQLALSEREAAVLAAVAYHQPLTREALGEIFGQEVSRPLLVRLRARSLITLGPRSPRPGAPYTYVTTPAFLAAFGLHDLRDLPPLETLEDTGLGLPAAGEGD